jgi:hypothetical protein
MIKKETQVEIDEKLYLKFRFGKIKLEQMCDEILK